MNPWLKKYFERGFRLVYYPSKQKGPTGADAVGWPERQYKLEDYKEGMNVGVMLGHPIEPGKYLIDVDFDWPDGVPMARKILPATGFGFGRASRKITHAFYTCGTPLVSRAFDNIDGKPFSEIRGTKQDGTLGYQTMVPPSVHPSEEVLEMRVDAEIAHDDDIERKVILYNIACMLYSHLGERGLLHDVRLALAGFLLQSGLSEKEATLVGEAIAENSGNNASDVSVTVHTTAQKIRKGEKLQGYTQLAKTIGDNGKKVLSRIREWLGQSEFITGGKDDAILANHQVNIARALEKMNYKLFFDEFSQRTMIRNGTERMIPFDDAIAVRSWLRIERDFHFKPNKDYFYDVTVDLAHSNPIHPVREWLSSLQWDRSPRLDRWLIDCAGAGESEYTLAVSRIVLLAAVRRVRQPGCKFDEMLILESDQGLQKSTLLAMLAVKQEWFSDDLPLDVEARELIERTTGKWIVEAAELQGMRASNMEHLKAMLSRSVDGPVRKAYGRLASEQPRQFIPIGTTNGYHYLTDFTGNRRFWPVRIVRCDLGWMKENRDQLWAEAAFRESEGESIRLPEHLYKAAETQQERRRSDDPWEQKIQKAFPNDGYRLDPDEVWEILGISIERQDERGQRRINQIMQRLGFRKMAVRTKHGVVRGWAKGVSKRAPVELTDEEIAEQSPKLSDDF